MDAVAETLRCDWDKVWSMPVVEFFNILSYRRDKMEKEKKDREQWQRTH